ncbi:hypothetical protein JCM4914_27300 [Streptomyces platensis subsp. malvinus]
MPVSVSCAGIGLLDAPERLVLAELPWRWGLACGMGELEVELAVGESGNVDGRQGARFGGQGGRQSPQGMVEIACGLRVSPDEQRIVGIGGDTRGLAKLWGAAALGAHGGLPQGRVASAAERREQAGGEQRGPHEGLAEAEGRGGGRRVGIGVLATGLHPGLARDGQADAVAGIEADREAGGGEVMAGGLLPLVPGVGSVGGVGKGRDAAAAVVLDDGVEAGLPLLGEQEERGVAEGREELLLAAITGDGALQGFVQSGDRRRELQRRRRRAVVRVVLEGNELAEAVDESAADDAVRGDGAVGSKYGSIAYT